MHRSAFSPLRPRGSIIIAFAAPLRPRITAVSAGASIAPTRAKPRKTLGLLGALVLAFSASSSLLSSPAENAPTLTAEQKTDAKLVRGRYLVEHVGLCADCHTPRNEKGQFVREQWLKGASLPFQPLVPMPWSPAAPPIAGLPTMTDEQAIAFMRTGKRPDGSVPRPPMPEFRFDADDASAVVAYLKSLSVQK